jgi:hypothetical protein
MITSFDLHETFASRDELQARVDLHPPAYIQFGINLRMGLNKKLTDV